FQSELGGLVPTTFWTHDEVGDNRQAKTEVTKLFGRNNIFSTPKSEALIKRVIEIATEKGDIVLDEFAGSGTTAAVAHKMHRRWVTIELFEQTVETFTFPRLEKVISGDDKGGISTAVGWSMGGGFRSLQVAESAFESEHGRIFLAEWVSGDDLRRVAAAQLGFRMEDTEGPFCGRRGRSRLAVVDGVADEVVV